MDDMTETKVRMAMVAAGLAPSDEEIESLVATYADYQAGVESLYAVPEARYASPALVFNAAPVFADWAE
ncbi:MAG TPA: hypothetical protein VG205_02045 [Acidimicrobiales bacterium]|jgi:hypothetical protein|nr:hypothetical protein [Acidimicrobiales bacterium]